MLSTPMEQGCKCRCQQRQAWEALSCSIPPDTIRQSRRRGQPHPCRVFTELPEEKMPCPLLYSGALGYSEQDSVSCFALFGQLCGFWEGKKEARQKRDDQQEENREKTHSLSEAGKAWEQEEMVICICFILPPRRPCRLFFWKPLAHPSPPFING